MAKYESGLWTGSGSSPQTITLADGSFGTPIAIIAWCAGRAGTPTSSNFATDAAFSKGFGTRRGGSTQSGCVGFFSVGAVGTGDTARVRNTTLLHVLSSTAATDYTVSLDSFGSGQFTVSYSSAANASGDFFGYTVILADDAIVLNWTMDSTGATEVVTGTGFQPTAMAGLDADVAAANSITAGLVYGFGVASSNTRYWSLAITETDGDTMTSAMNWNKAFRTDAFLERLTYNANTSDARWDNDSFDSDGATLGVVDAPTNTDRVVTLLFIKGGTWEAGTWAKLTTGTGGNDTVTLANGTLTPLGLFLGTTNQTAVGITADNANFCFGSGSTPNATRGSAVNNVAGCTGVEAINTVANRFRATDAVIEELTAGATETSEAWFDTASAGSFIVEWANPNGTTANLIGYLAMGSAGTTFNNNMTGAITFTGTLLTTAQKVFAGALTFVGTLVLQTQRAFAGAVTFVGDLVKQTQRAFAGAATFDGTLTSFKVFVNNMTGAVTFVGTLVLQAQKVLAGAVTFVGDLVRQTTRAFAGAVSFVGDLVRQAQKAFAGAVTFTGTRTAQIQKTLAGTFTPTATLTTVYIPGAPGGGTIRTATLLGVGS